MICNSQTLGIKNTQMCTYTQDTVVYVHILCTYKQVMSNKIGIAVK